MSAAPRCIKLFGEASKTKMPLGGAPHLTLVLALVVVTFILFAAGQPDLSNGGLVTSPNLVAPNQKQPANVSTSPKTIKTGFQPLLDLFKKTAPSVASTPVAPSNVTPVLVPVGGAPATGGAINPVASPVGSPAAVVPAQSQPAPGLNMDDPITRLDYSNINDEILNRNTANLVYFQANFNRCRNCAHFFDIWKELALDIRWWSNLIRLFVIDCSDEDNLDVCRRAGISEFPQVRFYWVRSNSLSQDGQRMRILGKSVHAMRHMITEKLMDSYLEHNRLVAKRGQQQGSSKSGQNPFSGLSSLMFGAGLNQAQPASSSWGPLATFLPLMNKFMSKPSTGGGGGGGGSSNGAGDGLLSNIMGMLGLGGGKPSSGTTSSPSSLSSLMGGLGGFQGVSQVMDSLMSLGSWRRGLTIQPLPFNWPELEPIELQDTQRILQLLPPRVPSLLVMETQEYLYTGLEVMLDLNLYSNQTYIARVRDERSQLTRNFTGRDDIQAPAMIYVSENREIRLVMAAPKYSNDEELRRLFVRAFDKRLSKHLKRVWSPATSQNVQPISRSQEDEEILERMNNIYMDDLINTIRASLMEQVFRHSDLNEDQYNALVKYVYALINYFPFQDDERLKFFKRLHGWLQNQVSPLDMLEYRRQFHDIDDALGKRRDWIACKSLSSINSVPVRSRKSLASSFFENPSQLGKVVSNITRLFRTNQQRLSQLKDLVGMLTSGSSSNPVLLTNTNTNGSASYRASLGATSTTTTSRPSNRKRTNKADQVDSLASSSSPGSTIERLIKSVTSGSLGSDSSILKLISSTLTGGGANGDEAGGEDGGDEAQGDGGHLSRRPAAKSKYAREYSCGIWKLAHVMVVNEHAKDSPRKDVKHLVLPILNQYMLHFYACPTCGNRVSDINGEFRLQLEDHLLQDQGDSIMLLWKFHNRVSKRLESELRPGSPPKQQFPPESLCPKCRAPSKSANRLDEPTTNPSWQEKLVLNFLVHHYKAQNIITKDDDGDSSSASPVAPLTLLTLLLATIVSVALTRTGPAHLLHSL